MMRTGSAISVVMFVAVIIGSHAVGAPGNVETTRIKTPQGREVTVSINLPDNTTGKHAAVVIAPGAGYHKDAPLIKDLAERLAANGVIAFRFDWAYFSSVPRGQPSNDLSPEGEDMQAVVNLARSDARVDPAQLVIAGKSMGSVIAFRTFKKNTDAKALLLMTPLCSSSTDSNGRTLPTPASTAARTYDGLLALEKPVVIALGESDPACSVPVLYEFLKASRGNVATVVVGGDHSLEVTSATDPVSVKRNAENVSESVRIIAHWVNLILRK